MGEFVLCRTWYHSTEHAVSSRGGRLGASPTGAWHDIGQYLMEIKPNSDTQQELCEEEIQQQAHGVHNGGDERGGHHRRVQAQPLGDQGPGAELTRSDVVFVTPFSARYRSLFLDTPP